MWLCLPIYRWPKLTVFKLGSVWFTVDISHFRIQVLFSTFLGTLARSLMRLCPEHQARDLFRSRNFQMFSRIRTWVKIKAPKKFCCYSRPCRDYLCARSHGPFKHPEMKFTCAFHVLSPTLLSLGFWKQKHNVYVTNLAVTDFPGK